MMVGCCGDELSLGGTRGRTPVRRSPSPPLVVPPARPARRPDVSLWVSRLTEAKSVGVLVTGDGGEEQMAQSEPEQGAAAEGKEAGDEGEGDEGGDVGVGAAGPAGGESPETEVEVEAEIEIEVEAEAEAEPMDEDAVQAGAGGAEQPPRAAVEAADAAQRVPRAKFTQVQVQELERIFRRIQYPDVLTR